ncbi:MAG: PEP-CTERM sorting domain-containing protein [Sedimentisphaerales bacterium]|nr:PEP-CTERM sorting domain-containing protein [Sedimentisphaerales bacterium]
MKNAAPRIRAGAWMPVILMGLSLAAVVFAQDTDDSYVLVIEASPAEGGIILPGAGVHRVAVNETVTLTAMAQQGYHFLYWLGDVTAADTVETTIVIDSPKIAIAIFERDRYGSLGVDNAGLESSSPLGQLSFNPVFFSGPSGFSGSSSGPAKIVYGGTTILLTAKDENKDTGPGMPTTGTPEPTTIVLLGLGGIGALRCRHKRHHVCC